MLVILNCWDYQNQSLLNINLINYYLLIKKLDATLQKPDKTIEVENLLLKELKDTFITTLFQKKSNFYKLK